MKNIITINQKLTEIIKKLSTVFMTGAIGLQLFYLYTIWNAAALPRIVEIIIWFAAFALLVHAIEGIIAFFWAFTQQKNPLRCAVYTFFTGTIGLLELFD